MASIVERGDSLHVVFRFGGRKFSRSLKTSIRSEAEGAVARLIENLSLIERGRLIIPTGADVPTFLLSDGKLNERPKVNATLTLTDLFTQYFDMLPAGNLEQSTIDGMRSHERQLCDVMGKRFRVRELGLLDLQRFVEVRSQGRGIRGRQTSAATIKKAVVTFRTIWNWALLAGLVDGPFPSKGLRYPKLIEKRPFQTFADIEARVTRGGLTKAEEGDLWEGVFLTLEEIEELLEYVWGASERNVAYPMFVFAAHTGARRSEMIRSRIDDIDFEKNVVTIRERKRARGKQTTRSVPLSPLLRRVLKEWTAAHPGGPLTFRMDLEYSHRRKDRTYPEALNRDEAQDLFERTLKGSRWEPLRGWHVFRHSFCSNLAATGVDQRLIDGWVGHTTDEMRRRYRHLIPSVEQLVFVTVFQTAAKCDSPVSNT